MKIALIQQSNTANRTENVAKLEQNIRTVAAQGAELIVLQELHNGLYFCQTENPEFSDKPKSFRVLQPNRSEN
jgi:N-carbamoylputrescine amidase